MNEMQIEDGSSLQPVKSGFYLTKKIGIIIGITFSVILTGTILATYFGKPNKCSSDLKGECQNLACSNPNLIQTWNTICFSTLAPTTISSTTTKSSSTRPIDTTSTITSTTTARSSSSTSAETTSTTARSSSSTSAETTSTTTKSSSTRPIETTSTTISSSTPNQVNNNTSFMTTSGPQPLNYRLPTDLKPTYYDLTIQPFFKVDEEPFEYNGTVSIDFVCEKNTNQLVLQMKDLDLDNSTLMLSGINDTTFSQKTNLKWTYNSITHLFSANFKGYTKNDDLGFYKSSYVDDNGQKKWLVTSQLEYIEARKSFICFDEPGFKAIFKIKIIHHKSLDVMSNMPIVKQENVTGSNGDYDWIMTEFNETVPMSTYLVAILISDFKCREGISESNYSNVQVKVCARPNAYDQLGLALNSSVDILRFFENYYQVKYPLEKLDHAGVPDFKYGAMENWGLAIYKETNFLFNDKSTQATESNVVRIIAHEISHMWFGNLVTPKWWNDLWLNEGFARFAEHVGSDAVKKHWRMFDRLFDLLMNVIQSDSSDTTRPVSLDVNTPEEIDANIDPTITYGKGSSIVKMLLYVLGEDTFRNGIEKYFKKYAYQNVDQFDLWNTLYEQAKNENKLTGVNITNVMTSWTKQKGHPVVHVKRINSTHISVSQNRFVLDSNAAQSSLKDVLWYVPLTLSVEKIGSKDSSFTNQVNPYNLFDKIIWIDPSKYEVILNLNQSLASDNFLIANLDMATFCRINYDENNWKLISDQLLTNNKELSNRTRAQLISDVFSLAQALYLSPEIALNHVKYLDNEFDYLPWSVFLNRIKYFTNILDTSFVYDELQSYLQKLVKPYYTKLGWIEDVQKDLWTERLVRNNLVQYACQIELPECIETAKMYFNEYVETGDMKNLPSQLRNVMLCAGIQYGTSKDFNFIFNKAKNTNDTTLRNDFYAGLSCSKEQYLLSRYLNDQLNTSSLITAIRNVLNKPSGNSLAWQFLKNNWNFIYEKFNSSTTFSNLLLDLSIRFSSQEQLNDVENFFKEKELTNSLKKDFNTTINRIQSNINWMKNGLNAVGNWLSQQQTSIEIEYRLPKNLIPNSYHFKIQPYIGTNETWDNDKSFTFDGEIAINFTCNISTNKIVFHALDLELHTESFTITSNDDKTGLNIEKRYTEDKVTNFITINMNKPCMQNAQYILNMKYKGLIIPNLYGFYRSSYIDQSGKRIYLATTHFQPTDARRAIPCFDEPAMKANFKLTMKRHQNFTSSFFNTPIVKNQTEGDWIIDEFDWTPKMSTYLVAFVVSNFETFSEKSSTNITVDIAAKPESIKNDEGRHAMDEAKKVLDFFQEYFDVKYPLEKSTQIAVPDFNAGAMENWGLVIYRENQLLYNPTRDTISDKRRVSVVVSHELAHQWFGNLVTPAWWNDLWLNEGFASWVEYLGYNHTHPEWRDLDFFFVQKLGPFVQDSLESSHPISVPVKDPSQINSLFDAISYSKGASIIRMMNAFLTENTFKKGVSNYLKNYSYDNAEQDNLWYYLTEQAHSDGTLDRSLSVKTIMDTWTLKKGYPVVHVERDYLNNQIKLSQKWFLLNPTNKIQYTDEYKNYKWYVPFTYTSKDNADFDFETRPNWLKPDDKELTLNTTGVQSDSWIIGNLRHAAFLRVNYDQQNWNLLINQLNNDHTVINPINRAELLDDSFNLGRAELVDQVLFLNITKYLVNEEDSLPFVPAFTGLNTIATYIESDFETFDNFKIFYKNLIQNTYKKLGWKELNDANEINLQISTIGVMCSYGLVDCIQYAKSIYQEWIENNKPIPPNFKSTIYSTIIKYGDEKEWFKLLEIAQKTTDNSEKLRMFRGLAATKDYNLIKLLISKVSDPNVIRNQDKLSLMGSIASNSISRKLVYDYLEENWNQLLEEFGSLSFTLPNFVDAATSRLSSNYDLERIRQFMRKNSNLGVATEAFNRALENINSNIRWLNKNVLQIKTWLSQELADQSTETNFRLPKNLIPNSYHFKIQPYIGTNETWDNDKSFTFDGEIAINFTCNISTNKIVFHALDLELHTESFTITSNDDKTGLNIEKRYTEDKVTNFITINMNKPCMQNAQYILNMKYKGLIGSNLYGFYRSSYIDKNGNTFYLATTQFQPTDARRAFPCFDEPAMKANFKLTMKRHQNFTSSLFNTPIVKNQTEGDWIIDEFDWTPKMSTYLVAFVVSNFNLIRNETSTNINIEVLGRPEAIDNGDGHFALNEAKNIIEFFENYFDVEYPLEKSTQVAVPDFSAGAMENWGLVIYRENALLFNEKNDTINDKKRVSSVVSHELAHQWFGNLVTPAWWNDLWLNEGFASWVEYLGMNFTHPEWRDLEYFFVQKLSVMELDSLESSHPVKFEVNDPNEINSLFDEISYDKGSSIIRMMNAFLTENTFKKGVSNYLKNYSYDNAEQDNLWYYLTEQAYSDGTLDRSLSVKTIMDTWTLKKGYPVVHVERDYLNNQIKLSQKWFLLNPTNKIQYTDEYKNYKWYVPFTYTSKDNADFDFETRPNWLKPDDKELTLNTTGVQSDSWIIGNLRHAAFLRVNYDQQNWNLLINQLNNDHTVINPINRAELLDDSFNLGRAELVDQVLFLNITKYLVNEEDSLPFVPAFNGLDSISTLIDDEYEIFELFKSFYIGILNNTYNRLDWNDVNDTDLDLQLSTLRIMCNLGLNDCIEKAKFHFNNWIDNDIPLESNLKNIIYRTVIKYSDDKTWYKLYQRTISTTDNSEKLRMFRGLASSRDPLLLSFLLKQSSDPNVIRLQDSTSLISYVAFNTYGRRLTYDYLEENWNELVQKFGSVSFTLPSLVESITRSLNSNYYLNRINEFVKRNPELGVAAEAFEQAIENIKINIRWKVKNLESIHQWLKSNN